MRPTCSHSNNRHRQAPSLKMEIQAVRTHTDMCRLCLFSLEAGRLSERPNKIGGFVVQGILRFTHLLSCRKSIADLPYKDNRKFAQSAGCAGINQLLVIFFMGLVPLSARTKLQWKIFSTCCGTVGFRPGRHQCPHSVKYD